MSFHIALFGWALTLPPTSPRAPRSLAPLEFSRGSACSARSSATSRTLSIMSNDDNATTIYDRTIIPTDIDKQPIIFVDNPAHIEGALEEMRLWTRAARS